MAVFAHTAIAHSIHDEVLSDFVFVVKDKLLDFAGRCVSLSECALDTYFLFNGDARKKYRSLDQARTL